jgi:hypothetical protein
MLQNQMLNKKKITYETLARAEQQEQKAKQDAYEKELKMYSGEYDEEEDDDGGEGGGGTGGGGDLFHNKGGGQPAGGGGGGGGGGTLKLSASQELAMNAPYGDRSEDW